LYFIALFSHRHPVLSFCLVYRHPVLFYIVLYFI
jgi:hypothetical protein